MYEDDASVAVYLYGHPYIVVVLYKICVGGAMGVPGASRIVQRTIFLYLWIYARAQRTTMRLACKRAVMGPAPPVSIVRTRTLRPGSMPICEAT
jgi:hypothetical protein